MATSRLRRSSERPKRPRKPREELRRVINLWSRHIGSKVIIRHIVKRYCMASSHCATTLGTIRRITKMALVIEGEERIAAPVDKVWAALNDIDVLKECIP